MGIQKSEAKEVDISVPIEGLGVRIDGQFESIPDVEVSKGQDRPVNWERVQTALNWDLTDVKRFMVVRQHVPEDFVEEIAKEYSRYLGIIAAYPDGRFPVSEAVDEMWHVHILFTRDYRELSELIRGEYINHDPVLTQDQRDSLMSCYFHGTLVRYRDLYQEEPPARLWSPEFGAICWSGYEIHPNEVAS